MEKASDTRKAVTPQQMRQGARKMTNEALETLQDIMKSEGQVAVRLSAAREILDRGYGRPKLADAEPAPKSGGMTVIVRKFTDPPACESARCEDRA